MISVFIHLPDQHDLLNMFRSPPHSKDYFSNLFSNIVTSKYLNIFFGLDVQKRLFTSVNLQLFSDFWILARERDTSLNFPRQTREFSQGSPHWGSVFTRRFISFFQKVGKPVPISVLSEGNGSLHCTWCTVSLFLDGVSFLWTCIVRPDNTDLCILIVLGVRQMMKSSIQWRLQHFCSCSETSGHLRKLK